MNLMHWFRADQPGGINSTRRDARACPLLSRPCSFAPPPRISRVYCAGSTIDTPGHRVRGVQTRSTISGPSFNAFRNIGIGSGLVTAGILNNSPIQPCRRPVLPDF